MLILFEIVRLFCKEPKIYNILEYLAGYSFFLYAIHTPFLGTSINKISQKIIPLHGILCLVQFLLVAFLTIVLGTMTGILLNKICPKLFRVLNGGRKWEWNTQNDWRIWNQIGIFTDMVCKKTSPAQGRGIRLQRLLQADNCINTVHWTI